jgi:hypothetical protein
MVLQFSTDASDIGCNLKQSGRFTRSQFRIEGIGPKKPSYLEVFFVFMRPFYPLQTKVSQDIPPNKG